MVGGVLRTAERNRPLQPRRVRRGCFHPRVHCTVNCPNLVALPESEVKEARDRVRASLQNAQFEFPARKITACPKN